MTDHRVAAKRHDGGPSMIAWQYDDEDYRAIGIDQDGVVWVI